MANEAPLPKADEHCRKEIRRDPVWQHAPYAYVYGEPVTVEFRTDSKNYAARRARVTDWVEESADPSRIVSLNVYTDGMTVSYGCKLENIHGHERRIKPSAA